MNKLSACIKLLRIHQWSKNAFIFLPAFFGFHLNNIQQVVNCVVAFVGFSFVASGVYVFNDWLDIDADREHPVKKNRPLASGAVSKTLALWLMAVLLLAGVSIIVPLGIYPLCLVLFYVLQNIAYCLKLKNYSIIDVLIISVGFVIRIMIGGAVTATLLSHWIIIITFLLALFLALAKRRDDVLRYNQDQKETRRSIHGYNLEFLNSAYTIMASVVIVAYIMYTVEAPVVAHTGGKLYLSAFFVISGMIRYLQVTMVYNRSGSPTMVFMKDRFLQAIIAGWLITIFLLLYVIPHYQWVF